MGMSDRDINQVDVCWIGGVPAHYTRALHREIEEALLGRIQFIYLEQRDYKSERGYERGNFPKFCTFLSSGNYREIWRSIGQLSPKIIVMAGHYPHSSLFGLLWATLHRRQVAYWSDTNILDVSRSMGRKKIFYTAWKRVVFAFVNTFLYTGNRNRSFYEYIVGQKKLEGRLVKLPYPALVDFSLKRPVAGRGIIRIVYLGRLISTKGIDRIIDAIALLPLSSQNQISLTVVGDGPERQKLEAMAGELISHTDIQFIGAVPSNKIGEVYARHDVLILPSHREPWGLVVNEALASGIPVIAPYWVGAVADLVLDGHSGFVMYDNQAESISRVFERILRLDRKELVEMGENGRRLVMDGGFHLDGATASLLEFLEHEIS